MVIRKFLCFRSFTPLRGVIQYLQKISVPLSVVPPSSRT